MMRRRVIVGPGSCTDVPHKRSGHSAGSVTKALESCVSYGTSGELSEKFGRIVTSPLLAGLQGRGLGRRQPSSRVIRGLGVRRLMGKENMQAACYIAPQREQGGSHPPDPLLLGLQRYYIIFCSSSDREGESELLFLQSRTQRPGANSENWAHRKLSAHSGALRQPSLVSQRLLPGPPSTGGGERASGAPSHTRNQSIQLDYAARRGLPYRVAAISARVRLPQNRKTTVRSLDQPFVV
jgi:hypothetical protein